MQAAGPFLYAKEAELGLILGLAENLLSTFAISTINTMPPRLLRLEENGQTSVAFIQTRPEAGAISHLNVEQASCLAAYLVENNIVPQGVTGPSARLLSERICALTGATAKRLMSLRVLAADKVIPPRPRSGQALLATREDFERLFEFLEAFHFEAVPHDPWDPLRVRSVLEQKITRKFVYVWKDKGQTVATAHISRPTRNGISISAVYTPPPLRGRGYASNLMAQLTQEMLNQGRRFCVLFTDASNPTSNKIYESVGYRVIGESEHFLTVKV